MELIERRSAWLTIAIAILIVFDTTGAGLLYSSIPTWELIVFLGGIFSLAGAGLLVVLSLAPTWFRPFEPDQRERFSFFALLLVVLAVLAMVTLSAHTAIHAHNHPSSLG